MPRGGRGHHGGHHGGGHHSGEGGGHRFEDWFYYQFGEEPEIFNEGSEEDYDDWVERFHNWYSDFMNDFFGDSGDEGDEDGEPNNPEAQTGDEMSPKTKKIIVASVFASAVALIILAVLIVTVVCCCVKKRKKSVPYTHAGQPTAPPRPKEVVIERHPKEIEAYRYALPYPSNENRLPAVEDTRNPQKMQVEVVQPGVDVPDSNPREYIDVFSPPPAYEPGERY